MTKKIRPAVERAAARTMDRQQWRHEYGWARFQINAHYGHGETAEGLLLGGYTDIPEVARALGAAEPDTQP